MRQMLLVLVGVITLAGCATSPSNSVAALTGPTGAGAANQVDGQQISINPTSRHFDCLNPIVPFTVTASTNFAGLITTSIDNPEGCTLSPSSAEAVATPGSGGTKHATFTVNVVYGCTVTFTDKKGNTARLVTSYDPSGSSCI